MKILIDLDSLLYVAIYKIVTRTQIKEFLKQYSKPDIRDLIIREADSRLGLICEKLLKEIEGNGFAFEAHDVEYYITSNIFSKRKKIDKNYKANRKSNIWIKRFKEFIITNQEAVYSLQLESDDLIAQRAAELNNECLVCSVDKDLNQIHGWHFDLYKQKTGEIDDFGNEVKEYRGLYFVSPEEAERFLWEQMLSGDSSDNIIGLKGIGKVKAKNMLKSDKCLWRQVAMYYKVYFGEVWRAKFKMNYQLIKIG